MWIQVTVGLWRGQSSSSSSPRMPEDLEEDFWFGGGDVEGAQYLVRWLKPRNKAPAPEHQPCGVCTAMSLTTSGRMKFGRCNLPGPNAMDANVPGHEDHQQQGGLGAVAGLESFNQS